MPKKKETDWGAAVAKAAKIIIGILIILAGLFLVWLWWPEFLYVLKGVMGVIVILIGLIVVALGATE
ncbi:hypothetical protein GF374_01865 [Candidatus Woesearchaeota archaeon]|nr:hypothetical protein [Candidatus Woesearchaeota archaeon]